MKQRHFVDLQIDARGHLVPHAANEASDDNIKNRPLYAGTEGFLVQNWNGQLNVVGGGASNFQLSPAATSVLATFGNTTSP